MSLLNFCFYSVLVQINPIFWNICSWFLYKKIRILLVAVAATAPAVSAYIYKCMYIIHFYSSSSLWSAPSRSFRNFGISCGCLISFNYLPFCCSRTCRSSCSAVLIRYLYLYIGIFIANIVCLYEFYHVATECSKSCLSLINWRRSRIIAYCTVFPSRSIIIGISGSRNPSNQSLVPEKKI